MQHEYQHELFDEFEQKESKIKRFSRNAIPPRKPRFFHFTIEQISTIVILIILALILSFALGIEKGKNIAGTVGQKKAKEIVVTKIVEQKKEETKKPVQTIVVPKKKKVEEIVKPYTIQLISYKDKNRATKTVGAFKRKGYQASMMRENGWYQVCVGSYLNKKEAEEDLKNFSQKYKDCFLRAKNK